MSTSVYVYVVDRGTIELCPEEKLYGVNWPASSPGAPISAECPKGFEGQSERICEQREFGKAVWLSPAFSDCLADDLADIYNEVKYENHFEMQMCNLLQTIRYKDSGARPTHLCSFA